MGGHAHKRVCHVSSSACEAASGHRLTTCPASVVAGSAASSICPPILHSLSHAKNSTSSPIGPSQLAFTNAPSRRRSGRQLMHLQWESWQRLATGLGSIRQGHSEPPEGPCSKEKPSEAARRHPLHPRCGIASIEKVATSEGRGKQSVCQTQGSGCHNLSGGGGATEK